MKRKITYNAGIMVVLSCLGVLILRKIYSRKVFIVVNIPTQIVFDKAEI